MLYLRACVGHVWNVWSHSKQYHSVLLFVTIAEDLEQFFFSVLFCLGFFSRHILVFSLPPPSLPLFVNAYIVFVFFPRSLCVPSRHLSFLVRFMVQASNPHLICIFVCSREMLLMRKDWKIAHTHTNNRHSTAQHQENAWTNRQKNKRDCRLTF